MQLLKAALAGLFVLAVGFFTAVVIAVSAVVLFVGRLLRGRPAVGGTPMHPGGARRGRARATSMAGGDVIDVDVTEVPATTSGR